VAVDPESSGANRLTIEALADENRRLRESLGSVLESSSWKLTKPLRRLRRSGRPEALPPTAVPISVRVEIEAQVPIAERASPQPAVPLFFPPGHFYSPAVDPAELALEPRRSQIWPAEPRATPGVDWRESDQIALCRDIFARQRRLEFREQVSDTPSEYYAQNNQYPPLDAWLLEAMLRWLRPQRMIEVGSGFSSLVTARVNREFLDLALQFTCIEPYPRQFLIDGVPGISELTVAKVQDVPLEQFAQLRRGDVLFIDTSHTVKTGGDVNWIYHEIIPRLAPGVMVHVHDAFIPGDYPQPWVLEGWGWNEAYLLRSFLTFNSEFEIVLGARYMASLQPDVLTEAFPDWLATTAQGGAALWFRRRG
jgi:predicted O-methyltransferase YrrM